MKFFKLDKNSKSPSIKWSDEKNYFSDATTINKEKNNIAFTGKLNNVFVLVLMLKMMVYSNGTII